MPISLIVYLLLASYGTRYDAALTTAVASLVTGPASATDGALVVFDSTTGKLVKDSTLTVSGDNLALAVGGTVDGVDVGAIPSTYLSGFSSVNATSAVVAAGGTGDFEVSGLPALSFIAAMRLELVAGGSTDLQIKHYDGNPATVGNDLGFVCGPSGGVNLATAAFQWGPARAGNLSRHSMPYVGASAWFRIYNNDGSNAAQVKLTIYHLTLTP